VSTPRLALAGKEPPDPSACACLVVIHGVQLGRKFDLERGTTTIGNGDSIRGRAEQGDIVGRWEADRFSILEGDELILDGARIPITISAGVAALASTDDGADGLIARADARLAQAKAEGRNRVVS
jgi:hypothetical protein